ncbi:MAG: HNH endonuclease [Opitutae bacterium]|nr:HNH endonuclease [Opitutae bacterium]
MSKEAFDWKRFHAYRVFDEFLERFVIQRKSYVTRHDDQLDLDAAFKDIAERFIDGADESDKDFEQKVARQFTGASEQTKIVFANVEYLWAMPMLNITPEGKRAYALRWFSDPEQVVNGERYFFSAPHIIANPGPWYLTNKYWEIIAALRVLSTIAASSAAATVDQLKSQVAEICRKALHEDGAKRGIFAVPHFCGAHPALMHLADPERYESIISDSHRRQIMAVFGHVVAKPDNDPEVFLKQIRSTLYDSHGLSADPDAKYRWFFYADDLKPLWIGKHSAKEQRISSAILDVRAEEDALDIKDVTDLEGGKEEVKGYRVRRSSKLAQQAKERDKFTCRACSFHFEDQIVHVHHLDPLSEYERPKDTKIEDLVTLCPTCHYLAHYWLRNDPKYKRLDPLLFKLQITLSHPSAK